MIVRRVPPAAAEAGQAATPAAAGGCAGRLALVDWEAVAVGSGPQDLGQFMISHASPAARRALAPGALRSYAAALTAAGCAGVTEEGVLEEYVQVCGGGEALVLPCVVANDQHWDYAAQELPACMLLCGQLSVGHLLRAVS